MSTLWTDESAQDDLAPMFPPNPPSKPAKPTLDGPLKRGPRLERNPFGPTLPLGLVERTRRPAAVLYERPPLAARMKRWMVCRLLRARHGTRWMNGAGFYWLLFALAVFVGNLARLWMGGH